MAKGRKPVTLEEFQDETALLPHVIANVIAPGDRAFADYASIKTVGCYNGSDQFHRLLNRQSGRDSLYAFMEHWYQAWLQKGDSIER